MNGTFCLAAARAVASSPSGLKIIVRAYASDLTPIRVKKILTLYADRGERHGKLQAVANDMSREIRKDSGPDQAAGHNGPFVESFSVLLCRLPCACIADNVASTLSGHARFGLRFSRV